MLNMRRREVITLLGGAAAWPLAAQAQQAKLDFETWARVIRESGIKAQ